MNQLAANTFGFYATIVKQADGSILAYRHDKPKLAESKIVYKSGIDGFWVTSDYQGNDADTTWKAGFDSSGDAVMNVLSVIGINFSWAHGGVLTLGGSGNGDGKLVINNSKGQQIGYIDNTGVHFNQGEFSGSLKAATGTFAGELNAPLGNIGGWKISNNPQCIYSGDSPGDAGITLYNSGRMLIRYLDSLGVVNAVPAFDIVDGLVNTYYQTLVSATLTDCDLSNPTRLLNPPTVSSGGHIVFAADGMTLAYLGSSSKRYKNHIREISEEDVQKLFEIPVVYFKYKDGYLDASDKKNGIPIPGFYAEDMEQAFPDAVRYEGGKVEDWNYRTLIPAMEKQIQILHQQNQELIEVIRQLKEDVNHGN